MLVAGVRVAVDEDEAAAAAATAAADATRAGFSVDKRSTMMPLLATLVGAASPDMEGTEGFLESRIIKATFMVFSQPLLLPGDYITSRKSSLAKRQ